MLFAGCSGCLTVVPIFCGGQLFPHVPMGAVQVGNAVGCAFCGITPPVFTCLTCFTTQLLYVAGSQVALPVLHAQGLRLAPVVQAQPNASQSLVRSLMSEAAKGFGSKFGAGLAENLLGAFFGGA